MFSIGRPEIVPELTDGSVERTVFLVDDELVVEDGVYAWACLHISHQDAGDEIPALQTEFSLLADVGALVVHDAVTDLLAVIDIVYVEGCAAVEQFLTQNPYGPGVDLLGVLCIPGHLGCQLVVSPTEGLPVLHAAPIHHQVRVLEAPPEVIDFDD